MVTFLSLLHNNINFFQHKKFSWPQIFEQWCKWWALEMRLLFMIRESLAHLVVREPLTLLSHKALEEGDRNEEEENDEEDRATDYTLWFRSD